ncbi:MAG TPA: O-antigen ligase family protein [Candidatus Eisenbacteria bacterium]|nr:O-antigen ligase family protein [Candidatus Eisenbacteria bacterium]
MDRSHTAAAPERAGAPITSRTPWVLAAAAAPLFVLAALAVAPWWALLLVAVAAALAVWSLADVRSAFLVAVLLATFVDYTTGRLTLQFAVVAAWFAWTLLVLLWRSAWTGIVRPPAEMLPGLAIWLAACAFGVAHGVLRGNSLRSLGVEAAGALWPLMGIAMMQAFGRRSLTYAALGLVGIGLIHTVFGLTMLQLFQQRLGGIYFTTVTGVAAVGLWTAALLAPSGRTRILCLAAMAPMLAHLLFSFTRGYWLGFVAGIAAATLLSWRNLGRFAPRERARRLLAVPVLIGVAVATLAFSALYFGPGDLVGAIGGRVGSSFSTELSPETLSNVVRLEEYDRAIGAALESPILGRGLGFMFVTRDLLTRSLQDQWFVHNYYLLLWLKLGVIGLAAFAALVWSFSRAALRAADSEPSWTARAWSIAAVAITVQVLVILLTNYSLADVNTASVVGYVWGGFWAWRAGVAGEHRHAYDPGGTHPCSPKTASSS